MFLTPSLATMTNDMKLGDLAIPVWRAAMIGIKISVALALLRPWCWAAVRVVKASGQTSTGREHDLVLHLDHLEQVWYPRSV
jgi:hypothetical protein